MLKIHFLLNYMVQLLHLGLGQPPFSWGGCCSRKVKEFLLSLLFLNLEKTKKCPSFQYASISVSRFSQTLLIHSPYGNVNLHIEHYSASASKSWISFDRTLTSRIWSKLFYSIRNSNFANKLGPFSNSRSPLAASFCKKNLWSPFNWVFLVTFLIDEWCQIKVT